MSNEELCDAVKARVPKEVHSALGKGSFSIIFTGKIRRQGNSAMQEASEEDLQLSVLRNARLSSSKCRCLRRVYHYISGQEPVL